jgi:hypothetical protein
MKRKDLDEKLAQSSTWQQANNSSKEDIIGECGAYATNLRNELGRKNAQSEDINGSHYYLSVETEDEGKVIIDPTAHQFTGDKPFIGSEEEHQKRMKRS